MSTTTSTTTANLLLDLVVTDEMIENILVSLQEHFQDEELVNAYRGMKELIKGDVDLYISLRRQLQET
jgi:hypothetical protein